MYYIQIGIQKRKDRPCGAYTVCRCDLRLLPPSNASLLSLSRRDSNISFQKGYDDQDAMTQVLLSL